MEILKLQPAVKDYIWGGEKFKKDWNKESESSRIAECWELSLHKDGVSIVKEGQYAGKKLDTVIDKNDYGTNCGQFPFFPVLIKLIDAKENLSIQVHPSDKYALNNENQYGKTELWYIIECEKGAGIYCGFKKDIDKDEYKKRIQENTLLEVLNFIDVKKGESYFIKSGTVHAICKGITICEIQQNSNLTYRVYDYNRVDSSGKTRELHIKKALDVSALAKYSGANKIVIIDSGKKKLCACKYFTVYEYTVNGDREFNADEKSFNSITFLNGDGQIGEHVFSKGDTFFIPANYGRYNIKGDCIFLMTKVNKFYMGIDIGGTNIKGGIIDDEGNIVISESVKTESVNGPDAVIRNIVSLINMLFTKAGFTTFDIEGIGICLPGTINSKEGIVTYSNNIEWEDVHIVDIIKKEFDVEIRITNDANAAALGEAKFGGAKNYKDSVFVTLGTGVGGGIVINGQLAEGNMGAGAEVGHMVIIKDGEKCTCGRSGCLESYASATALIRQTKKAMQEDKNSVMWQACNNDLSKVSGKTAFECQKIDKTAKMVVENYIEYLAEGLTNIASIFRPEIILLGGGVCKEGDNLIVPLQKFIDKNIFGGKLGPKVPVKIAELGNNAGFFGAAALLIDNK